MDKQTPLCGNQKDLSGMFSWQVLLILMKKYKKAAVSRGFEE